MDMNSDLSLSTNWGGPLNGLRAPLKGFGVDIRQA